MLYNCFTIELYCENHPFAFSIKEVCLEEATFEK